MQRVSEERLKKIASIPKEIPADTKAAFQREIREMARELLLAREVMKAVRAWPGKPFMTAPEWIVWINGTSKAMDDYLSEFPDVP